MTGLPNLCQSHCEERNDRGSGLRGRLGRWSRRNSCAVGIGRAGIHRLIARGSQCCSLRQLEHADQDQEEGQENAPTHQVGLVKQCDDSQQKQNGRPGQAANQDVAVHWGPLWSHLTRRTMSHAPSAMKISGHRKWTKRAAR